MASGWILWVWFKCIGVVRGCCCKEAYRFPHNITYPYSTCISSFFVAASLPLCSFFKCSLSKVPVHNVCKCKQLYSDTVYNRCIFSHVYQVLLSSALPLSSYRVIYY